MARAEAVFSAVLSLGDCKSSLLTIKGMECEDWVNLAKRMWEKLMEIQANSACQGLLM